MNASAPTDDLLRAASGLVMRGPGGGAVTLVVPEVVSEDRAGVVGTAIGVTMGSGSATPSDPVQAASTATSTAETTTSLAPMALNRSDIEGRREGSKASCGYPCPGQAGQRSGPRDGGLRLGT